MTKQSVVIYGPAGCGKTRNAEALRTHFGLRRILDHGSDLSIREAYPPTDTLILTTGHNPPPVKDLMVVSFDEGMRAIRSVVRCAR